MPVAHILRRSPIASSFRVEQVRGMFDVPHKTEIRHEWNVDLPIDAKPWLIGLIVGASGSGKTTIAGEVFKDAHIHSGFDWSEQSILDNFPAECQTKEVVECLSSVGLSSPPHWLKRFAHLSNGQKFRVELARLLLSGHKRVVFDEFSSVVDRDVAKICSATLAKTIRRRLCPQLVAVSCHFDVIDWLQPDWIFDVDANRFEWRELRRRPEIQLSVYQTDVSTWRVFRGHHYLSADIHKASKCYVATWNDRPVAFSSAIHFVHPKVKSCKREHRTVVLPDYQGVGIGNALSEFVAARYVKGGFRFISTTSHPAMIRHRMKSSKWKTLRKPSRVSVPGESSTMKSSHSPNRITASFEFKS
jgi:ABC-type polar amino acid transport system ATPase subunit/GNAT superfamily N-acetyltransferase